MSIQYKTLLVTGALLVAGVATVSASTINQPAKLPAKIATIPVATGRTATTPNVTPQFAAGNFQNANYRVQTTAPTVDQYNNATIK